jgi:hypothetical protein
MAVLWAFVHAKGYSARTSLGADDRPGHTTRGLWIAPAIHSSSGAASAGMDTITSLAREPDAFRFLSIVVGAGELRSGSLLVACTDDEGHPGTIVAVDEVPADPPQHSRVRALGQLLELVAASGHAGGLLAVSRRGECRVQGGDLAWHDAFAGTSQGVGLVCHGTYLVTPVGMCRVRPRPLTVAA